MIYGPSKAVMNFFINQIRLKELLLSLICIANDAHQTSSLDRENREEDRGGGKGATQPSFYTSLSESDS